MRQTNDATTAAKELFAERLKDKLTEYDIKQNALAEDLGVSESTVGKWILGKSMPRTMGMIEKIAARLHVGKSYFLEAEPPAPPAASEKPHKNELSDRDERDIQKRLQAIRDDLDPDSGIAMLAGEGELSEEDREAMLAAVESGLRMAKLLAKKYTPKKYRADEKAAPDAGRPKEGNL